MYSRSTSRTSDGIIRLPEHYGGTAFSEEREGVSTEPPGISVSTKAEVGKPTPLVDKRLAQSETEYSSPKVPESAFPIEKSVPLFLGASGASHAKKEVRGRSETANMPEPFRALFGSLGGAFPFSHGLGFDESLILGLIVLLGRNGADTEMVLLLALLLFCG